MIIIIDISNLFQKKPGFMKAAFKHTTSYRVWWLWFGITVCNMSEYDYYKHIESGNTIWKFPLKKA